MESAFGVDHGDEVSKGLPGALKGGLPRQAETAYGQFRQVAHREGRAAAKNFAQSKGAATRNVEQNTKKLGQNAVSSGQGYGANARGLASYTKQPRGRADRFGGPRAQNRVLP